MLYLLYPCGVIKVNKKLLLLFVSFLFIILLFSVVSADRLDINWRDSTSSTPGDMYLHSNGAVSVFGSKHVAGEWAHDPRLITYNASSGSVLNDQLFPLIDYPNAQHIGRTMTFDSSGNMYVGGSYAGRAGSFLNKTYSNFSVAWNFAFLDASQDTFFELFKLVLDEPNELLYALFNSHPRAGYDLGGVQIVVYNSTTGTYLRSYYSEDDDIDNCMPTDFALLNSGDLLVLCSNDEFGSYLVDLYTHDLYGGTGFQLNWKVNMSNY